MHYDISLSASKLSILGGRDGCERCFWLANQAVGSRIERPRGIFPSLPGGIDRVMKNYLDGYRGNLPPLLAGQQVFTEPAPVLWGTVAQIQKLRYWKSGLKVNVPTKHGVAGLIGALDELLCWPAPDPADMRFSPLDVKSKGDEPKTDGSEYYQVQMDLYGLLLERNGMPLSGAGYLCYLWPSGVTDGEGIQFASRLYRLDCRPERSVALVEYAMDVLSQDTPPPMNPRCEYCRYAEAQVALAAMRDSLDDPADRL